MKNKRVSWLAVCFFSVAVFLFADFQEASAAGPTIVQAGSPIPSVWTKEGSPYLIPWSIYISIPITIEPGVVVKLDRINHASLNFKNLTAVGTEQERIYFTSMVDDSLGGDTSTLDVEPQPGDWREVSVYGTAQIEYATFLYGGAFVGTGNLRIGSSDVSVTNSEFKYAREAGIFLENRVHPLIENNLISDNVGSGIVVFRTVYVGDAVKIEKNSIVNNGIGIFVWAPANRPVVDARNNWWGDVSGPFYKQGIYNGYPWNYGESDNLSGGGNKVRDAVLFRPWLGKDPTIEDSGCQENCFSNVLFLPGHQASRLYRKDGSVEDQLWEPTNHNEDVQQLYLNPEDGSSNDLNIYTRDVLDEVYDISNIYKSFMASMDKFVADGFINNWQSFAYDWRRPLEEVVDNGTKLEDGNSSNVLAQIRESAKNSKTGKVTLIGHSNGGLLAKIIIDQLKKTGEDNLVDRVIMVATPQLGTPKAIASLLHGDGSNMLYGLILDKKTARGFGENMISAYNLMPSKKYFEMVQDPVIEFDSDVKNIYDFPSIYGDSVNSFNEFKSFVLGDDGGRTEPDVGDIDSPNVLKNNFFSQAEKTHELLDSWQAPEGMEVIQIAGWGLDTIRGIKYDDCDFIFCPDKLSNLDRSPIFTQDGDETVVVPSAMGMDGNVERYYVDLKVYNNLLDFNFKVSREHADILEIESLQEFIKNIIQGSKNLTEYVYAEKPEVKNDEKRLRYRLHSPVALHIYDNEGRHTGLIENKNPLSDLKFYEKQIPNSYYMEFGETKYAGAEGNIGQKVVLKGEDLGTFTFDIDEVVGKENTETTTFVDVPVMQGMEAEIQISDSVGEMKVDVDRDGQVDAVLLPGEDIGKDEYLEIFEKIVGSLSIDQSIKDRLVNKIENVQKQLKKDHGASSDAMLADIKHQIEVFSNVNTPEKFRISKNESEKLIEIIEKIRVI